MAKYQIISDISRQDSFGEVSFCIKIVNGVTTTYTGKFNTPVFCPIAEIMASCIGLNIVEPYLKKGDHVEVYSDTTEERNAKLISYLRAVSKRIRREGKHIYFYKIPKKGDIRLKYADCHRTSRGRLRVKHKLYPQGSPFNNLYENSVIWKKV